MTDLRESFLQAHKARLASEQHTDDLSRSLAEMKAELERRQGALDEFHQNPERSTAPGSDGRCLRCRAPAISNGNFCTVHQKRASELAGEILLSRSSIEATTRNLAAAHEEAINARTDEIRAGQELLRSESESTRKDLFTLMWQAYNLGARIDALGKAYSRLSSSSRARLNEGFCPEIIAIFRHIQQLERDQVERLDKIREDAVLRANQEVMLDAPRGLAVEPQVDPVEVIATAPKTTRPALASSQPAAPALVSRPNSSAQRRGAG